MPEKETSHLLGEADGLFSKGSFYDDLMGKIIVRRGGSYYKLSIVQMFDK